MKSQRFLQQVASYFFFNSRHAPVCIIFPNKRSAIYFRRYFKLLSFKHPNHIVVTPTTTTIGQFLEQQTGLDAITDIEALFELYESYRHVASRHGARPMEFERFVFWGRMLISDFNDVDASLADVQSLYKNLSDLKEISSNFLTEEQLEVLQYVFGRNMAEHYRAGDNGRFWRHIGNDGSDAHSRFVELWQLLADIYKEYTTRIASSNKAYTGLMERTLSRSLQKGSFESSYAKYAFVGFNAPSVALMRIMQLLQRRDNALFFWDKLPQNSPVNKRAGRRVSQLATQFPMPDDYEEPDFHLPKVNVCAVPSKTMQTKEASSILRNFKKEKLLNTSRPDNTALILPDASLLSPMIQSLPNDLGEINITMGMPMRNTFFASVMRNIITLQVNADIRHGEVVFRSQDVRAMVSNPRLLTAANKACCAVIDWLDSSRTYMVSARELMQIEGAERIAVLFDIIDENDSDASYSFLCRVLDIFKTEEAEAETSRTQYDAMIVNTWQRAVDNVFDYLKRYSVTSLGRNAYFGLVWRILSTDEFHVSGSPLVGLQVMGMLETRALDFDNIIVLSVNENICPPRHAHRTFIPAMLRRAFGLPTADDYALEYDYYFLRMLSRSNNVTFIYDSRTSTRRNARSHLIDQLVFMRPDDLKMEITHLNPEVELPSVRNFAVNKTPDVMKRVNRLLEFDSGVSLSASSLKTYRKCPLEFYLKTICKLRDEDEPEEYMSAAVYGSVVHLVLENIFNGMRPEGSDAPAEVTVEKLQYALNRKRLHNMVLDAIDKLYHHDYYKNRNRDTMPGESLLLADMMADYIEKVLEKEIETVKSDGPFKFVSAEEEYKCVIKDGEIRGQQLDLGDGRKVNFTFIIDRHDIMADGTHRFIDYKTGADKNKIGDLPNLFDEYNNTAGGTNDAALQLLMYTEAYKSNHPEFHGSIMPVLYKLQKAFVPEFADDRIVDGNGPLIWSENAPWRKTFVDEFKKMIDSIFDPGQPFRQTRHLENCKYCTLLDFCMRKPKEF